MHRYLHLAGNLSNKQISTTDIDADTDTADKYVRPVGNKITQGWIDLGLDLVRGSTV